MRAIDWKDVYERGYFSSPLARLFLPELFEAHSIEDMRLYSPRIKESHLVLLSGVTVAESGNEGGLLKLVLQDSSGSIEAHVNPKNTLDTKTYESARALSVGSSLTLIGLCGQRKIYLPGKVNDSLVALPINRVAAKPDKLSVVYIPPVTFRQKAALRPCNAINA